MTFLSYLFSSLDRIQMTHIQLPFETKTTFEIGEIIQEKKQRLCSQMLLPVEVISYKKKPFIALISVLYII